MKRYVQVRFINAEAMTRGEYNRLRGWKIPDDECGDDRGFLIEQIGGVFSNHHKYKGHISWCPIEVFEISDNIQIPN